MKLSVKPIVHELYTIPKRFSNDIALLKLDEEVNMTMYTTACLPPVNTGFVDQIGNAYGKNCKGVNTCLLNLDE